MAKRSMERSDRKTDKSLYIAETADGFISDLTGSPCSFPPEGLGGEAKMETEGKEKLTVEDIGAIVRNSGFKVNESEKKTVTAFLERLSNFMTIEKKNGNNDEAVIRKLLSEGILSENEAKKALAKLNGKKTASGGIKYEESQRASINFSRTSVNHVLRLVRGL